MTWGQPQGQQQGQYPTYDPRPAQYQPVYNNQYVGSGQPPQTYYHPPPYQNIYQPSPQPGQQVYTAPVTVPPKKNTTTFVLIFVVIIIVIIAAVGAALIRPQTTGPAHVQSSDAKVHFIMSDPIYGISILVKITVTGNITNIGTKDIKYSNVKLKCDGSFLDKSYSSTLETDATSLGDELISPGERVPFYSDLGGTKTQVSSTKDSFEILEGIVVGSSVTVDVGPYYR